MRIATDCHAQNLKMLLFIRQAWVIAQDVPLPELSPAPDVGASHIPTTPPREVWENRWKREWNRIWAWYDSRKVRGAAISQEEMQDISRPGQELHPIVPPFWSVEYGTDGLDLTAFTTWDEMTLPVLPLRTARAATPALVAAWRDGLTTIIVLPYSGYFAERLSTSHLVVSAETRQDPDLYSRALTTQR
ncbi:hypothetical protein E8P82_13470 [Arthrobacter echini]|uniref:Uncharacterized protein n=1 Tax=Arthrobacter echini TaxID=1529066 RepID=A0A4V3Z530_9MICC|nr:hypothetical protein [Arthrobacter echini]THJ64989.1 hypothetical protein E8P82_13470 [Arthrobacter echini]